MPFRCITCGEEHDELPDIGSDMPDQIRASLRSNTATASA